jgi:hypothetical protein
LTLDNCRVFFNTRQRAYLPSVFFLDTRQRTFLSGVFLTLDKDNLKITFESSKLIRMKKNLTTNLYNSSRCTIYILIVYSYDKIKVNLFIKPISLSYFVKL